MGCSSCQQRRFARLGQAPPRQVAYIVVDDDGRCLLWRGDSCRAFVDEAAATAAGEASLVGSPAWTVAAVSI